MVCELRTMRHIRMLVVIVMLQILFSKVTLVNHGAKPLRTPLAP
jgi:hypothetical protein